MDVGRVAEAIASILLNLPQLDKLIALRGAEQKVAIILSGFILCCHDSPPLQRYLLDVNRSLASKAAESVRPCTSATPPKADVNSPPWLPPLSARRRLMQRSKMRIRTAYQHRPAA